MSKGFLEQMTSNSLEVKIKEMALEYRNRWSSEKSDSEDCEEFGKNEYFGGKAEGFEESLEIIKEHMKFIYNKRAKC